MSGYANVTLPDGSKKVIDLLLAREGSAYADAIDRVGEELAMSWLANNLIVIVCAIIIIVLIIYIVHIHNKPDLTGVWLQETTTEPVIVYLKHNRHSGDIYVGDLQIGKVLSDHEIEIFGNRSDYSYDRINVQGFKATRVT
jgi:hypothetical protein